MKTTQRIGLFALACLALSGCSSDSASSEPSESTASASPSMAAQSSQPPTRTKPSANERGNFEGKFGETYTYKAPNGEKVYSFSVEGIELDAQCKSDIGQPAQNGHLVRVDLKGSTGTAEQLSKHLYMAIKVGGFSSWSYIFADGTTFDGPLGSSATFACLPQAGTFPPLMGPSKDASGSMILDLPSTDGTLVYTDSNKKGSWEWSLSEASQG